MQTRVETLKFLTRPIGMTILLGAIATSGQAQEITQYATPTADGKGYTINYEALGKSASLNDTQKFQIARALRNGRGHVVAGPENIAGLGGSCSVKEIIGIPVGVNCTLTASPTATLVLSGLGAFVVTNAMCLIIDAADDEITEPICDVLLESIVKTQFEPVITECAESNQSTNFNVSFSLVPSPSANSSASCS